MSKKIGIVTVTWRDYSQKYLTGWIEGIRKQDYAGEKKIYITDNETSPETAGFIARTAPEAGLILNKTNDGFAKGMNDGMRQAIADGCEYVLVLNIHTAMTEGCVREMVRVLERSRRTGVVQARQMMPDKTTINSLGCATHFLGFGYCLNYREKWSRQVKEPAEIFYASGTSMLFRAADLGKIGLFDEEYWMYNEDQELPWRFRLAGYRAMLAPRAVLYSNYQFQRSITKFYWMDRNRIISTLICYKWPTLLLITPPCILMELGHILFSLKGGWFRDKLRVWGYFLKPRTWAYLHRARQRNQKLRTVKDREIARLISGRIWYQEIDDWKLRVINPVFDIYWRTCRKLIFW